MFLSSHTEKKGFQTESSALVKEEDEKKNNCFILTYQMYMKVNSQVESVKKSKNKLVK